MEQLTNNQLTGPRASWPAMMELALQLAGSVLTATPNPRVGCVLVQGEEVIGQGCHQRSGTPHAEVNALNSAAEGIAGATAFVTLEPCSHHGKTGPCADALLQAGVATVVIASIDPNPSVNGSGIERLQKAGVNVFHLVDFEPAAKELNAGFFSRHQRGRPWVRCKLAASLDGRTALANGQSKWITGLRARAEVQLLRARSCAVITGINSVLADNSALTVRPEEFAGALQGEPQLLSMLKDRVELQGQPLRGVVDSALKTPADAAILGAGNTRIFAAQGKANPGLPASAVVPMAADEKGVCLASVLEFLCTEHTVNELLVEAGPVLSASFLEQGLVDELIVFMAPKLMGSDSKPLVSLQGLAEMSQVPELEFAEVTQLGQDLKIVARPVTNSSLRS